MVVEKCMEKNKDDVVLYTRINFPDRWYNIV